MSGYFHLELNPKMAFSLCYQLNSRYTGAQRFELRAPDAAGTLTVWARTEKEANDHLVNALFDLIFARNRVGAAVLNPDCIFCGGPTESRGRNCSGTRVWRCLNPECRHSFTPDRTWRGGINHPSHSKKPAFRQLVFEQGIPLQEAADRLGISHGAADNWFAKMQAVNKQTPPPCPCGKPMRHRGSCSYRMQYGRTVREQLAAAAQQTKGRNQ